MTDQEVGAPTVNVTDGTASLLKAGRGGEGDCPTISHPHPHLHLHPRSLSAWADTNGGGTLGPRNQSGHPLDGSRWTGSRTTRGGGAWWRCRSGDGVGAVSLRLFACASARLVRCSRARMATVGCVVLESTRTKYGTKEKRASCVGLWRPVWCLDFIVSSFSVRLVRLDGEVLGVWGAVDVRSRRPKNQESHQSDKAGKAGSVDVLLTIDILETFCSCEVGSGGGSACCRSHVAADLCVFFSVPPTFETSASVPKLPNCGAGGTVSSDRTIVEVFLCFFERCRQPSRCGTTKISKALRHPNVCLDAVTRCTCDLGRLIQL